ncbi:MAG: hypothetical protein GX218_01825 [Clostridiaceae bacterium]|nr:hypothetical protein [Clostridiaceae bacterium]
MKCFSESAKQHAIDLYFTESLTTQQAANRSGYPPQQKLKFGLSGRLDNLTDFKREDIMTL